MSSNDWNTLFLWIALVLAVLAAVLAASHPKGLGPFKAEGAWVFGWLAVASFVAAFLVL